MEFKWHDVASLGVVGVEFAMYPLVNYLKPLARKVFRPPLHKPDFDLPYVVLGSEYGGWPLLTDGVRPCDLIYSFGVGTDIGFDLDAIATFGCRVHAFDPTPRSVAWMESQSVPPELCFHPIGIADYDGDAEFFAPADESFVSFSISPEFSSKSSASVKAKVMRLQSIIDHVGGAAPDVVKIDVEGFEYGVINDILRGPLRPGQLLVEFHHGLYGIANELTLSAVRQLRAAGYLLYYVSPQGREYAFVHASGGRIPSDCQAPGSSRS